MKEFDEILSAVEKDTTSGSNTLVTRIVEGLMTMERSILYDSKPEIILSLQELISRKPFFFALNHLLETLKNSENWEAALRKYKDDGDTLSIRIAKQFIDYIDGKFNTYLLHSNSKTIIDSFKILADQGIKGEIFQTKSYPGGEGFIQRDQLKNLGFKVILVDDDPSEIVFESVDILITGADAILDKEIINKTGTRKLAEKIHALGKPYIVLADSRKWAAKRPKTLPPSFEYIPRRLITKIIMA